MAGGVVDAKRGWGEGKKTVRQQQHYENSSLREKIVEHLFVGAALKSLWALGIVDAEILRSEFDGFGYDLVLTHGKVVRHIQLKSGLALRKVEISRLLAEKPSGCVVFIELNNVLDMRQYFFYGDVPGSPLPNISELASTKRTTPNAIGNKPSRTRHHDVPAKLFRQLPDLESLLKELLGEQISSRNATAMSVTQLSLKQFPIFHSDEEAEEFVATADLSEYDMSGFKPTRFDFVEQADRSDPSTDEKAL